MYRLNPNSFVKDNVALGIKNYEDRSPLRLFYSIGAPTEDSRKKTIPNTEALHVAIPILQNIALRGKINLIFHYMFIEDINSSEKEVMDFLVLVGALDLLKLSGTPPPQSRDRWRDG